MDSGQNSATVTVIDQDSYDVTTEFTTTPDRYQTGSTFPWTMGVSPAWSASPHGRAPWRLYLGYFDENDGDLGSQHVQNMDSNASSYVWAVQRPSGLTDNVGYVRYELGGRHSGGINRLGAYYTDHVWFVNASKPGIKLEIEEDTVIEGESFTVKVTATPAPAADTTVNFSIDAPNGWITARSGSIVISMGEESQSKQIQTNSIPGTQSGGTIRIEAIGAIPIHTLRMIHVNTNSMKL